MSIDDEFIQTIIANPDDDAPRLIYADWLEEQGDPRGEFIRIQCELAKMPEDDPRRWDLELRQGRLMRWYGWQWWFRPFEPTNVRPKFRRGFVEETQVYILDLLASFEEYFHVYRGLRRLTVVGVTETHVLFLCYHDFFHRLCELRLPYTYEWSAWAQEELRTRFGPRVKIISALEMATGRRRR